MTKYKDTIKKQNKSSLNQNIEKQKMKPEQQEPSGLSNLNQQKNVLPVQDSPKPSTGGAWVLLGALGCVLTSPLILLGGLIGAGVGLFSKTGVVASGLFGANLGSLGFLSMVGLSFGKSSQTISNSNKPEKVSLNSEQKQSEVDANTKDLSLKTKEKAAKKTQNASAEQKATTDSGKKVETVVDKKAETVSGKKSETVAGKKSEVSVKSKQEETIDKIISPAEKSGAETYRVIEPLDLNNPEKIKTFLQQIYELVIQSEAKAIPKEVSDISHVEDPFIKELISIVKAPTATEQDFWERMDQMSDKDIQNFVSKLSSDKKGKHSSSELDFLWRRFKGVESQPSAKERKKDKFAAVVSSLSEQQLSASFNSPDFLNILNQEEYRYVAVNTMTSRQLELFAADSQRHTLLAKMIIKLKPDEFILGKLVAVMPQATQVMKGPLIQQLSHLSPVASFNIELCKLAEHFIKINNQALQSMNSAPSTTKEVIKPPSKWATVIANAKPVYADTHYVEKEKWSDEVFNKFIQQLNSPNYLVNQVELMDALGNMPDDRVKMMVEKASPTQYKDLLSHLWAIESKPSNQGSYVTGRKHRLKIVLENLTEEQLKDSIKDNKFWDIFRNTQQPHCKMAAGVLTPEQFKTIISNATLERHSDFATLLTLIKKDSPEEKQRLINIIKEVIPHTSPWFALALEVKIKDLLVVDKALFNESNAALKQHLSESLKKIDVNLKYKMDMALDKKALSNLVIDVAAPAPAENKEQAPTFGN